MKEKIKQLLLLRGQEDELNGLLKAVKDEIKELQEELIGIMDSTGISQLESETGEKLSLVRTKYTNVTDFLAFQNWCELNGSQDLLKLTFDRKLTNELCFGLVETDQPLPEGIEVGYSTALRLYKGRGNQKSLLEVLENGK